MVSLNLRNLDPHIVNVIELREATDQTFFKFVESDYTDWFWDMLAERSNPNVEHSAILSVYGTQGVGKSLSALAMAAFMDPNFSIDNVFFKYDDLVYKRHLIRPNSVILMDEQSEAYGIDSHRVNIIIQNLKEQLRKKSVHFLFCAPVLYPEHQSSMFLIEVMFVDYSEKTAYAAFKTREGLTLGHIKIPHPVLLFEDDPIRQHKVEQLLKAYETKKDEHLNTVLNQKNMDQIGSFAQHVMAAPLFKMAEKLYKKKLGYIPQSTLIQIINKVLPEFNAGVMSGEVAQRIKLEKELSLDWDISGRSTKGYGGRGKK
jgi:ABC-type dipeptide/oligopeptide/nickel transport system ATPase component